MKIFIFLDYHVVWYMYNPILYQSAVEFLNLIWKKVLINFL